MTAFAIILAALVACSFVMAYVQHVNRRNRRSVVYVPSLDLYMTPEEAQAVARRMKSVHVNTKRSDNWDNVPF